MTIELSKIHELSPSDVRWFAVDFTDDLSSTETLSTVSATQIGSSLSTTLTIASVAVNAGSTDIDDRTISIGKGVSFKVSGQGLGYSYRVRVNVTTSSGETMVRDALFDCK